MTDLPPDTATAGFARAATLSCAHRPRCRRFARKEDRGSDSAEGRVRCAFFVAVALGLSVPSLLVGALITLVASTYCLLNFWRCREAHCIVSGTEWGALAVFELTGVVRGTASPMGTSPSYSRHPRSGDHLRGVLASAARYQHVRLWMSPRIR